MGTLNEPQRRRAWQALAVSEALGSDDIEPRTALEQALPRPDGAADDPRPANPALVSQSGTVGVAALGQRRVDSVGCPHCDNRDVVRWGHASELPRYRCKACSRTFNALTKTPLAKLRMKEKWGAQAEAMIDGVSTAKAARRCGVHYTTAFRWRHRFLAAPVLGGFVRRQAQGAERHC